MSNGSNKIQTYIEIGGILGLIAITSIGAWILPDEYHSKLVLGFLAMGVLFDLLSAFYHVMTIATGKFMSGFPIVGLIFYGWFLLASRFSFFGRGQTELGQLLLLKMADAVVLVGFHALCQRLSEKSR